MMKRVLLVITICFCVSYSTAQETINDDSKFSLGIHHPMSIGDNFIKNAYNGILGLDVAYKAHEAESFVLKAGLGVDYFNYNFLDEADGNAIILKPRIIGEFKINSMPALKPYAILGYSFFNSKIDLESGLNTFDPMIAPNATVKTDYNGINYGVGVLYDISTKVFINLYLDFISLNVKDEVPDISYNKNVQTLNIGLGINL